MKANKRSLTLAAALAVVTLVPAASAVESSWLLTSGSGSWNDGANWSNGVPVASGTANLIAPLTVTSTARLLTSGTTGILNIASGNTFNMVVSAAAGASLFMDNGGSAAQINILNVGNINNVVLNLPIVMTSGGLVISGSTSGARAVSGSITTGVASAQTLTLRALSSGNLTVNSVIGNGSGTTAVVIDNSGVGLVQLNGSNTFTGGLTVRNGGVFNTGLGAGTVTLGDALTSSGGTSYLRASAGVTANNIVVSNLAPSNATATLLSVSGAASTAEFSGTITLNKALGLNASSGTNSFTLSNTVTGTGALNVSNGGSGTALTVVTLSGSSTFSGGIVLGDRVRLNLGHAAALGTGTLTFNGTNNVLDSTVANLTLSTNNAIALNQNIVYAGTGGNSLNVGTGSVTFAGNKTITVTDGILTIGGMLIGGNNLTKEGAGVLALNGANTYTGETAVNAGTLRGNGSTLGDVFVLAGATLEAGNSIGTFTVGGVADFSLGGTFRFELDSTNGTFDQLVANGVSLDGTAQLSLFDLGLGTWTGGSIIAIDNTSAGAIVGTFAGLNEGDTVMVGANAFTVTYFGGDGNDFALQVVPEPGAWVLATVGLGFLTLMRRRRA